MANFKTKLLGFFAFTKIGINSRGLVRNILLHIYRLFFKEICIGHQDRLEKAEYDAPDLTDGGKTRKEINLKEFRSFNDQLKNTSAQEDEFIEQENSHALSVSYASPEIIDHHDVYYDPTYRCLYDEEGQRIKSSFALSRRLNIPEKIQPPKECKVIDQSFLYIGGFEMYHYGHFLVEGISQLWALAENSDMPVFYASGMESIKRILKRRKNPHIDELMGNIPISRDDLYCSNELIRFNSIKIPQPTFVFGRQIFNQHRLIPEYVAQKVIESNSRFNFPKYDTIYLSRSKLKDGARSIINERELEECLSCKGVRVVYPETLTLSQQIILLNSCKNVIAPQGSALHNILFILTSDVKIYTIASEETWLGTFYMIDKIKEPKLTNKYIFAMGSDSGNDSREWMQNKLIDVDKTMMELSANGLFG